MGIKAIDYENLKEGELITWYGVHVLRWEDEIRPYGIEPTIAFVQDDTLDDEITHLRGLLRRVDKEMTVCLICHTKYHTDECELAAAIAEGDDAP